MEAGEKGVAQVMDASDAPKCKACGKPGHNRRSCGREPVGGKHYALRKERRVAAVASVVIPKPGAPASSRLRVRNPEIPKGKSLHLTKGEQRRRSEEPTAEHDDRPQTRGECADGPRPCPWVSCRYHTYLEVSSKTGTIRLVFPHLHPWELEHTCALDVAEQGGLTLDEVGGILNLTRERVRQIETRGLLQIKRDQGAIADLDPNCERGRTWQWKRGAQRGSR